MAGDIERSEALGETFRERGERLVLRLGEGHVVRALELHADGKVVAALAALPRGHARMPRALLRLYILNKSAVAPDQIVRTDSEARDVLEIRMRIGIEATHEQVIDPVATVFAGGKRDVVNHQKGNDGPFRTFVEVRRLSLNQFPGDPADTAVSGT